jgi:hypothetical protein
MTHPWHLLGSVDPHSLSEARLQLHYGIQFLAAPAAALINPEPDNSHSSLRWHLLTDPIPTPVLISGVISSADPFQVALDPVQMKVMLLSPTGDLFSSWNLAGQTLDAGLARLKEAIAQHQADAEKVVWLTYPEDFPVHALTAGAAFMDPQDLPLQELVYYYDNTATLLNRFAVTQPGASPLRIWPHHFDMAVLIQPKKDVYVGTGFSPGDRSYPEPYWYVTFYPYPDPEMLPPLPQGSWHTQDWVGAIQRASQLSASDYQKEQLEEFFTGALQMSSFLLQGEPS